MANKLIRVKSGNDKIVFDNAFISEYKGTGNYTYTLDNDSIYLIIVNAGGDNYGGIELISVYNNVIYHTTIATNPYATFSYSGLTVTITVRYTNAIRIMRI